MERIKAGSFYILCPDNETPRETDLARMEWNVNDVIQDRPACHDGMKTTRASSTTLSRARRRDGRVTL